MRLCRRLTEPTQGVRGEQAAEQEPPPDRSVSVAAAQVTTDAASASEQLLRAHARVCATCSEALAVADLGEFCVGRMCADGQTVLEAAIRLHRGAAAGYPAGVVERFLSHVDASAGPLSCHPWTLALDRDGYGDFWPDTGTRVRAHRFALELKLGRRLGDGEVARHARVCTSRACCNGRHLTPGTIADNVQDREDAGRTALGERNGNAKLTAEDIVAIRARAAAGGGPEEIAGDWGVGPRCIRRILAGETWRHVSAAVAS